MDARRQWYLLAGLMLVLAGCLVLIYAAEGLRHFWTMMILGGQ
jgi:hypothetical protein